MATYLSFNSCEYVEQWTISYSLFLCCAVDACMFFFITYDIEHKVLFIST